MRPVWKDRLARVREAVDREIGEAVRVVPMRAASQYAGPTPDPARAVVELVGVFHVGEGDQTNLDGGMKTSWMARIPVGTAEVHIDPDRYSAALEIVQGDRIEATERGGVAFEVARIDRRRRNRLTLRLNVIAP